MIIVKSVEVQIGILYEMAVIVALFPHIQSLQIGHSKKCLEPKFGSNRSSILCHMKFLLKVGGAA